MPTVSFWPIARFSFLMFLVVSSTAYSQPQVSLSFTNFGLEWYGLNGDMNGQPGSETRDDAIRNLIENERLWSDVMVFQEVVDVPRLQANITRDAYHCTSYDDADSRHQHVVVCVRRGLSSA